MPIKLTSLKKPRIIWKREYEDLISSDKLIFQFWLKSNNLLKKTT
jgi:hypothetical protein